MTVKQFFKSTTFKCLITLLCVLLVSGVFLTIMSGLLKVTDEERFQRALSKIYGKTVQTEEIAVTEQVSDNADINSAYLVKDDGNYLINATGKGGFDNGTVTCWVVVVVNGGAVSGVDKVVVDSNEKQSYIGNISDKFLSQFKDNFVAGTPYNANVGFVKTGATFSAGAICRAVNAAVDFVNAKFGNVKEDIFKDKPYTQFIDTPLTSAEYDEETKLVTFEVVTTGAAPYLGKAGAFTIKIVVDASGVIKEYEILTNGSTSQGTDYKEKMNASILDGTLFVGKNFDGILAILGGGVDYPGDYKGNEVVATGASQSNHQCIYAAAFATANYKSLLPEDLQGGTEGEEGDEGETENNEGENNDGGETNE